MRRENQEGRDRLANNETARLAVLIDADNASASVAKELLEEVAKYGTATVKRAYGDWTTSNLVGWKVCLKYTFRDLKRYTLFQTVRVAILART